MAKPKQVAEATDAAERRVGEQEPFSGDVQSPDTLREPSVQEETTPYDERTGVQQPWLKANGEQDNGYDGESEGARAAQTREADTKVTDK